LACLRPWGIETMSLARRILSGLALRLWLPVALLGGWWLLSAHSGSLYFPPLRTITVTFGHDWLFRLVPSDVYPSVQNLALGFALATVGGVAAGTVIAQVGLLRRALEPFLHFLRSIPPPALLPFGLVVLGEGASMKVFIIAIGAVWPTLLNTVDGIDGIEPLLADVASVYQLNHRNRLWRVVLPAAGPQIFAGIRTTLQISIILMIVSEMVASTGGIGFYVLQSEQSFSIAQMWAGTILIGLLGYLANAGFSVIEHRALRWQSGQRLSGRA